VHASEPALDHLSDVAKQVPTVDDLLGLRCAQGDATGIFG
jgi:hypothetical protein